MSPRNGILFLLCLALLLPGCAAMFQDGSSTLYRVYDLGELAVTDLDPDRFRTFAAMVREVVGENEWLSANSSLHILDKVVLIRTTKDGQEQLGRFFSQFRTINERG